MRAPTRAWPARLRWLVAVAIAVVVLIHVAGIWGIAFARRGALRLVAEKLRVETAARARQVEAVLSSARAELLFLVSSPDLATLEGSLASPDAAVANMRRRSAEASLLLLLRARPELIHLVVRSPDGRPLVEAGRRGGVPVVWRPTGMPIRDDRSGKPRLVGGVFSLPESADPAVSVEAVVDLAAALAGGATAAVPTSCELRRDDGTAVAVSPDAGEIAGPVGVLRADAAVRADGWADPPVWTIECRQHEGTALALVEPVAETYRATLFLNLAVMGAVILLAGFVVRQSIRRERSEARAREEERVREIERQLYHTERLSTMGRLAAGMAHEVNNPLEGMSNYLMLASDALKRNDAASAERYLERTREGLEQAAGVVRGVLAHAEPSGKISTSLDLGVLVSERVDFVRSRPEFGSIRWTVERAAEPLRVLGDATMLGQIVTNLLVNACEAQPDGGEVRLETRAENGAAVFEVADRGPGVPAEERERIFEPFQSGKGSTGLGLSISYSIAKRHDGDLEVRGRPGGGAIFRLSLPLEG